MQFSHNMLGTIHILRKRLYGGGGVMAIFRTENVLTGVGGVKKNQKCAYVIHECFPGISRTTYIE